MNMIGLLLGVMAALSVLACGGCQQRAPRHLAASGNMELAPLKVAVNQTSFSGVWYSACARDVERDELFRVDTLTVTADLMDYSSEFFADSKCSQKYFLQNVSGFYTLDAEKVFLTYSKLDITPEASIILASFNLGAFCAVKDWKFGELRSFPDASVCGYPISMNVKVARFGDAELVLGEKKLLKIKSLE